MPQIPTDRSAEFSSALCVIRPITASLYIFRISPPLLRWARRPPLGIVFSPPHQLGIVSLSARTIAAPGLVLPHSASATEGPAEFLGCFLPRSPEPEGLGMLTYLEYSCPTSSSKRDPGTDVNVPMCGLSLTRRSGSRQSQRG